VLIFHPVVIGQEQHVVRCSETHCLIGRAEFEAIVRQAQQVEKLMQLCGWGQR
jgi:hypothetical protein